MTPFYAQGLNAGLEDCTVLDSMIEKYNGDWKKISSVFTDVRKPNTDAVAQLS